MPDRPARILLAEDDRFLRRAGEVSLKRAGHDVLTASDGEEALRLARAQLPDLILLDLIMPRMQGFQVLTELKKDPATASIRVLVLSNLGQEHDVKRAMETGAHAYFVKANLSLPDLVRRLPEALEGAET